MTIERYMQLYGNHQPKRYILKSSDGRWYDLLKSEVEALGDGGEIWACESNKAS